MDIVERDAAEFKPLGNKIHSYQRISPSSQEKGKGVASVGDLDPEREDVIEYEVYHVSTRSVQATRLAPHIYNPCSRHGIPRGLGSTTEGCKYSSSFTLRAVHTSWKMNRLGSSWYCEPLPLFPLSAHPYQCSRYEKRKRRGAPGVATYHFAGYTSLYPFYCFPERIRLRLRYSRAHVDRMSSTGDLSHIANS